MEPAMAPGSRLCVAGWWLKPARPALSAAAG